MQTIENNQSTPVVFIVDDDSSICTCLSLLLESLDIETETFLSGKAFLERYEPDQPGCLLLDVRMPEMSGFEVQARLLEQKIHLPVIMISGNADVPMALQAMKNGVFDFIEKGGFNSQVQPREKYETAES